MGRTMIICKVCNKTKELKGHGLCKDCYSKCQYEQLKKLKGIKERKLITTKERIFQLYQKRRYSANKIAKMAGLSVSGVRLILHKMDVKMRTSEDYEPSYGRLKHGYYMKINTYKKENPKCEICGWDYSVDIHHILQLSNGGSHDKSNLISLCPNHHRMVHLGIIDLKRIDELKKGDD